MLEKRSSTFEDAYSVKSSTTTNTIEVFGIRWLEVFLCESSYTPASARFQFNVEGSLHDVHASLLADTGAMSDSS